MSAHAGADARDAATGARIPLAGIDALRKGFLRARVVRLALAAALVASLAGALLLSLRHRDVQSLIPAGSNGVIVLDVSGSIGPREYRQLVQALDDATTQKRRYGLVVFSDTAYEVFPPGSDPGQVRALRRFFVPARKAKRRLGTTQVGDKVFFASPWAASFTGGTLISKGLDLARAIVERDRLTSPTVLLVSDLVYDPHDFASLQRSLAAYESAAIPIRIVSLTTRVKTRDFFDAFQDTQSASATSPVTSVVGGRSSERVSATTPVALALACGLLLLLLAANELACGRLRWSSRTQGAR